jgi:hypothetical protein
MGCKERQEFSSRRILLYVVFQFKYCYIRQKFLTYSAICISVLNLAVFERQFKKQVCCKVFGVFCG